MANFKPISHNLNLQIWIEIVILQTQIGGNFDGRRNTSFIK
jgi:hypothetical protein